MAGVVLAVLTCAALAPPSAAGAQGADSAVVRPTPNLVADGVPPIPASLPAEVRRYTEARSAGLADWHPTRRELLITTRFGNTPQLHQVAMPLGARRQLTFFDEPVVDGQYEPGPGRYLVFSRDVGGNEFAQLYRYDVADGRVTLLTDGGRSQNGNVEFSTRGDRVAYGSTRRNGADRDLYVMDPRNPASDRMVFQASGGGWGVADWSPDDRRLLVGEYLSVNQSRLHLVDVATAVARSSRRAPPTRWPTGARDSAATAAASTSPPTRARSSSAWRTWTWRPAASSRSPPASLGTWRSSTCPRTAARSRSWPTRPACRGSTSWTRAPVWRARSPGSPPA
jgi:hypothetical protein